MDSKPVKKKRQVNREAESKPTPKLSKKQPVSPKEEDVRHKPDEALKNVTYEGDPKLTVDQRKVYREALNVMNKAGVPYAVGASFARHAYTGIWRQTKDLDIFLQPEHLKAALDALREAGFDTEVPGEHWLAKAWKGEQFIDLIFGTGHGQIPIDARSFEGIKKAEVLGVETCLIPLEEMIASAAYIAVRNRFDGGEVVHLIRSAKGKLDWQRILDRLGENRELLLWHLILFDFIYPGHSSYLPKDLMVQLFDEARQRWSDERPRRHAFRGSLLDPFLFHVDVDDWGYEDRRITDPLVNEEGETL